MARVDDWENSLNEDPDPKDPALQQLIEATHSDDGDGGETLRG